MRKYWTLSWLVSLAAATLFVALGLSVMPYSSAPVEAARKVRERGTPLTYEEIFPRERISAASAPEGGGGGGGQAGPNGQEHFDPQQSVGRQQQIAALKRAILNVRDIEGSENKDNDREAKIDHLARLLDVANPESVSGLIYSMRREGMASEKTALTIERKLAKRALVASTSDAERAAAKLRTSDIVYNRPSDLPFGKPSRLVASVASNSIEQAQARAAVGAGEQRVATAMLTPTVRAELQGPPDLVDIQALGPAEKGVSTVANSTWEWNVTPKTIEPVTLTLAFYNQMKIDGTATTVDGPTYTDTFVIKSSWLDWLLYMIKQINPLYAVIASCATVVGGVLLWWKKWKAKPE